jgi:hypothetical protein
MSVRLAIIWIFFTFIEITFRHMKIFVLKAIFLLVFPFTGLAQDSQPKADRHEFVKKGKHKQELALGDYVVMGVFKSEENAKTVANEYKKQDFPEASYGYCSVKSMWFVCMGTNKDIEAARASRDKYRENRFFKDAWLLTVHE